MKVLVGCEFSGRVRDAFIDAGHDAASCDLRPSESLKGRHIQGNVLDAIDAEDWDIIILHWPCDDTAISGARWFPAKVADGRQQRSLALIKEGTEKARRKAKVGVAVEQPMSITHRVLGPVTQTVQPWQFGHPEKKATCFWLWGLPKLQPTNVVPGPHKARVHRMSLKGGKDSRKRNRARTFPGIAAAMAEQWGRLAADAPDVSATVHLSVIEGGAR